MPRAIQCWRSLQDNFGCATCVTMSMMGEELMPSACEVDIMGALSMYALALASGAPPAILDWNNNYGQEPDMCVCTHCGNFPKSFIGDTPEISANWTFWAKASAGPNALARSRAR